MHSTTAIICTHHIRYAGSAEEPAIYALWDAVDKALSAWETLKAQTPARDATETEKPTVSHRGAKRRYFRAKARHASDVARRIVNDDPARPTLDRNGQPAFAWTEGDVGGMPDGKKRSTKTGELKARFADPEGHRSESEYRRSSHFRRGKPWYRPGRYADTTGEGFWNTSIPSLNDPKPVTGASATTPAATGVEERVHKPLPPLPEAEEDEKEELLDGGCELALEDRRLVGEDENEGFVDGAESHISETMSSPADGDRSSALDGGGVIIEPGDPGDKDETANEDHCPKRLYCASHDSWRELEGCVHAGRRDRGDPAEEGNEVAS